MPALYETTVMYHMYAIVLLVFTIVMLYLYTQLANDFIRYKKHTRILMPIYAMSLAVAIYTGAVLMAQQPNITLASTIMVILALLLIALEVMRHKALMRTHSKEAFGYKVFAKRVYAFELLAIFLVSYLAKAHIV